MPQLSRTRLWLIASEPIQRPKKGINRQGTLRARVKVMIGGAPVNQAYADEIGADGYARDSTLAVARAKELLGVPVNA